MDTTLRLDGPVVIKNQDLFAQTGAIVTNTDHRMSGRGGLDKEVHRLAGARLAAHCAPLPDLREGGAYVTPSFDLAGRGITRIIHTLSHRFDPSNRLESAARLHRTVMKVLSEAKSVGITKISLPLLGTGALGYSPIVSAETILSAMVEFNRMNAGHFEEISLVIPDATVIGSILPILPEILGSRASGDPASSAAGGAPASSSGFVVHPFSIELMPSDLDTHRHRILPDGRQVIELGVRDGVPHYMLIPIARATPPSTARDAELAARLLRRDPPAPLVPVPAAAPLADPSEVVVRPYDPARMFERQYGVRILADGRRVIMLNPSGTDCMERDPHLEPIAARYIAGGAGGVARHSESRTPRRINPAPGYVVLPYDSITFLSSAFDSVPLILPDGRQVMRFGSGNRYMELNPSVYHRLTPAEVEALPPPFATTIRVETREAAPAPAVPSVDHRMLFERRDSLLMPPAAREPGSMTIDVTELEYPVIRFNMTKYLALRSDVVPIRLRDGRHVVKLHGENFYMEVNPAAPVARAPAPIAPSLPPIRPIPAATRAVDDEDPSAPARGPSAIAASSVVGLDPRGLTVSTIGAPARPAGVSGSTLTVSTAGADPRALTVSTMGASGGASMPTAGLDAILRSWGGGR